MAAWVGRHACVRVEEVTQALRAQNKRPLYAFALVAALCAFLLVSASLRGNALGLVFHTPVPISGASASASASGSDVLTTRELTAKPVLPTELTVKPLSHPVLALTAEQEAERAGERARAQAVRNARRAAGGTTRASRTVTGKASVGAGVSRS